MSWDEEDFEIPVMTIPDLKPVSNTPVEQAESDEWHADKPVAEEQNLSSQSVTKTDNSDDLGKPPMLLVNLTVLSSGAIHNRNDPHSVNDPDKKRALSEVITAEFYRYKEDGKLITEGTIRPCAQSVWPAALAELRRDYPGQFWTPIFPPTMT